MHAPDSARDFGQLHNFPKDEPAKSNRRLSLGTTAMIV
jgi:hypothetical protein